MKLSNEDKVAIVSAGARSFEGSGIPRSQCIINWGLRELAKWTPKELSDLKRFIIEEGILGGLDGKIKTIANKVKTRIITIQLRRMYEWEENRIAEWKAKQN